MDFLHHTRYLHCGLEYQAHAQIQPRRLISNYHVLRPLQPAHVLVHAWRRDLQLAFGFHEVLRQFTAGPIVLVLGDMNPPAFPGSGNEGEASRLLQIPIQFLLSLVNPIRRSRQF